MWHEIATRAANSRSSLISMTGPDRDDLLITSGEVARRLELSTSTVSAWVRQGLIAPAVRTAGGRLRFPLGNDVRGVDTHVNNV